jgi:hypothetical protein
MMKLRINKKFDVRQQNWFLIAYIYDLFKRIRIFNVMNDTDFEH